MEKTSEQIVIEGKLNAIKAINEHKDNAERAIEILSNTHVDLYDVRRLFMAMDDKSKVAMLLQHYQNKRLEFIDKAKELMK